MVKYSLNKSYINEPTTSTRLYLKLSLSVGACSLSEVRKSVNTIFPMK